MFHIYNTIIRYVYALDVKHNIAWCCIIPPPLTIMIMIF